jgi:uncharacterized membrane protein HdeD (DUF308 family)
MEGYMAEQTALGAVRQASGWSVVWGVALVFFGMLAIGSPFLAAIAVSTVISWLLIFAGVVHIVLAFQAHGGAGGLIWKLLVGLAYIAFGGYLLMNPQIAVASLTLVLATLFLVEGVLDIVLFSQIRPLRGSAWVLIDGIVTILLAALIYYHWPSSSVWAIGTLVGVSMIISGLTRIMLSFAVRKVVTPELAKAA